MYLSPGLSKVHFRQLWRCTPELRKRIEVIFKVVTTTGYNNGYSVLSQQSILTSVSSRLLHHLHIQLQILGSMYHNLVLVLVVLLLLLLLIWCILFFSISTTHFLCFSIILLFILIIISLFISNYVPFCSLFG